MSDASTKSGAPVPYKVRTVVHGGRGVAHTHSHSKNKTWVSGRASGSPSPAPDERWERSRGGITLRVRGGRGGRGAMMNGHASRNGSPLTNVTEDEDDGVPNAGPSFSNPPPGSANGTVKTWEELVKAREEERTRAIREGKMDDPTKPKRLDEAITIVGTCQDMCPEFERYRRERENNLDKWESILGPDGRPTKKVDHTRAVKIYERGQGDKIIPSDLRPAPVLKRTLDYLFHDLIPRGGFADTQAFVRDRSRAVRNDFTIQQDAGPVAMECHERCTRFHILSLHLMYDVPTFDRALEIQQLMNSLLSLKEFYDDQRETYQSPNELEMRIYHRLGLIRDQHERNDRPPPHIAADPAFQLITRFRSEVQRASIPITKTSQMKVSAEAMQTFGELAGVLRERRNIIMIYLIACFLEHIFGKDTIDDMESVKGSLSIQDIIDGNSDSGPYEAYDEAEDGVEDSEMDEEMIQDNVEGEDDELSAFVEDVEDIPENDDGPSLEVVQPNDEALVPSPMQRGATSWLTENFGNAPTPPRNSSFPQSKSAPVGLFPTSAFGTTQTAVPSGDSVFGQLVSSSSFPSALGNTGTSSVFGTALNAFGARPNVFGGPVFSVPPSNTTSTPLTTIELGEKASSTSSIPPSTSTVLQESKRLRSLADAAPLASAGDEDHVDPSEAIKTEKAPPFPTSKSAPVLNPSAPSFEPSFIRASQSTPFASGSRATLSPIRTDSLLRTIVDTNRGMFTTTDSPTYSPSPLRTSFVPTLSINTDVGVQSKSETRKAYAIDSPLGPPPLKRKEPISLPGTPTAQLSTASMPPSMPPVGPTTPTTPYHFPALRVNISSTTTSTPNPVPTSTSRITTLNDVSPDPGLLALAASSHEEIRSFADLNNDSMDSIASTDSQRKLNEKAYSFRRTHGLVPEVYKRWKQKAEDTERWKEACLRSEKYRQKIHESASGGSLLSLPSSSSLKRQRSASEVETEPPKRVRSLHKRISNPMERRTDEELAEKLMQNREKHERRWARGLFVMAIQEYVQSRTNNVSSNWATWLCMNPDNDKTAIWLEQKFDVPQSGNWESDAIFSIPVSSDPPNDTFPGLIVFERTPMDEGDDDIEKKYHVLDDCSRLRDILQALPSDRRRYTPSLLFISWDASSSSKIDSDISDLIAKHLEDGTLRDSVTILISPDDTEEVFTNALAKLNVDVDGPSDPSVESESVSQVSSPTPSTPSTSAKRTQISQSPVDDQSPEHSFVSPSSPTPSTAPSVGNSSVSGVTAAMLRALSRDILKRYGGVKRESTS